MSRHFFDMDKFMRAMKVFIEIACKNIPQRGGESAGVGGLDGRMAKV